MTWGLLQGWVSPDAIIGSRSHYGKVEAYAGRCHPAFHDNLAVRTVKM